MKKKLLALVLVLALVASLCIGLAACNGNGEADLNELTLPAYAVEEPDYSSLVFPSDFKIGLICLHDENSTYDKNFINAMQDVQAAFGLSDEQVLIVTGIPETDACYTKASELVTAGCDIIFADSFGHEASMVKAAKAYPSVQFCHATGVTAATENLANYANAFASIYEGRYLAGVAAGLKLNEMGETKMGYVGAYTYAEVVSGYSSFYLGAKSVCPNVTMDVTFTGSWYDETAENNAAKSLIAGGCKLISQHADSMGAPNACEEAGVPNISYNGSTLNACPDTFIVSSRINWAPYFKYAIAQVLADKPVATNWTGTIKTGSVVLTNVGGNAAAANTVEKIVEVRNALVAGTTKVFDCSKFTVGGAALTVADANVKTVGSITYFDESGVISAPSFDKEIDGITRLNTKF